MFFYVPKQAAHLRGQIRIAIRGTYGSTARNWPQLEFERTEIHDCACFPGVLRFYRPDGPGRHFGPAHGDASGQARVQNERKIYGFEKDPSRPKSQIRGAENQTEKEPGVDTAIGPQLLRQ